MKGAHEQQVCQAIAKTQWNRQVESQAAFAQYTATVLARCPVAAAAVLELDPRRPGILQIVKWKMAIRSGRRAGEH